MSTERRVLVADRAPGAHVTLEPALRRAGWTVLTVKSSFDVLRTLRDHSVDLVLIAPELPGTGVSGVDVVRTLKAASRFRSLPVLWLLRDTGAAPAGVPADGTLALDRLDDRALLAAIEDALTARPGPLPATAGDDDGRLPPDALTSAVEAAVRRYCECELRKAIPEVVREIAREVVPEVAERLIRQEIARLRAAHGFHGKPGDGGDPPSSEQG